MLSHQLTGINFATINYFPSRLHALYSIVIRNLRFSQILKPLQVIFLRIVNYGLRQTGAPIGHLLHPLSPTGDQGPL